jgi:cobalt-zinc-cadmium efflux system outer membrane protein
LMCFLLNTKTMEKHFRIVAGLFLIILSESGFTQDTLNPGKILTFQELVAAIDQNPSLLAFDEKMKSYEAYSQSAKSLDPPKITSGFWMYPYSQRQNGGSLMIGAEQMIMSPSKRKAEQKYMAGMSSVEQTMKDFEKQDMLAEAKKIYYEWIVLEKKKRTLKESEEILNLMIRSAEIGYTYNQNLLSRVYKAKSELYTIQNMQIMVENEIKQMNVELNILMNINKELTYKIDTTYRVANYDLLPIDTATLKANRSDIKNIDESIRLFNLQSDFILSKRKPDFGVQYAHMQGMNGMQNQFNLMGMVTIPIAPWSAKGYKASLKGIQYESSYLNLKKEAIINETIGRLQKLKAEIGSKKRQVEMYEKNIIPALEKNFNASLISFEHMKEDMFMTIDAWVTLKMAKLEYLNLLGELLKLQADYERQIEKK